MKRKLLVVLSVVIMLSLFVGCGKEEVQEDLKDANTIDNEEIQNQSQTIKFFYRDGIPALTVAKLVKENPSLKEGVVVDYEMLGSPDLLVTKILKGEADIAIAPSNLVAQAYNKNLPYRLMGTSVWGTLYLASTEDIKSIEDLKGKEIYSFGKGLTPDIVFRYVLSENGINPESDININYLNSASELGPAFISGKTNLAMLPEPLATNIMSKKEDTKIIFDINKEWGTIVGTDKGYPQASLIIKSDLIDKDIEFVENFIKAYEESMTWANENPEKLGEYAEELELGIDKKIISKGNQWIKDKAFAIKDSKEEYEIFYKTLLDFAPDFIGGKLPDEELYFER